MTPAVLSALATAASRPREYSVLVVGGEPRGEHADDGAKGGGGGRSSPPSPSGKPARNPQCCLRLVECNASSRDRNDVQHELLMPGETPLSMVCTLPSCRVALVGAVDGAVFTVSLGREDGPVADKLRPRGQPVRPHAGAVSALASTADELLLFSGGADGSVFVYQRAEVVEAERERLEVLKGQGGTSNTKPMGTSDTGSSSRGEVPSRGVVPEELRYTDVQCVSREQLELSSMALSEARANYAYLETNAKTELQRLESLMATAMASKAHEQTEALAAAERRARALAAEHNTAIASMQSRFADFAAKLEEKRRAQQSHLESVLRREIAQYDEVKGQIGSATEAATAERTRLMTELNVVLAAHEAAAARHAADVEAVQSEHEAALDDLEKATEARQLQLIHEYDETLVRAPPLILCSACILLRACIRSPRRPVLPTLDLKPPPPPLALVATLPTFSHPPPCHPPSLAGERAPSARDDAGRDGDRDPERKVPKFQLPEKGLEVCGGEAGDGQDTQGQGNRKRAASRRGA